MENENGYNLNMYSWCVNIYLGWLMVNEMTGGLSDVLVNELHVIPRFIQLFVSLENLAVVTTTTVKE